MPHHALAAVDFSPASEQLEQNLGGLKRLGIEQLTLVYVLPLHYGNVPQETHEPHYHDKLQALAERLSARGFSCELELRSGEPHEEIERAADEHGAELIVAGQHGHHPVRDFLLGSTALAIARTAQRPALLLPLENADEITADTLLFATDASTGATTAEAMARVLQPLFRQTLAVAVADAGEDNARAQYHRELSTQLQDLEERLPGVRPRVLEGDPAPTLVAEAERENAGLIVIGKRGHNPLVELLLGSTTERVLRRSKVPVLVVPQAIS